MITFDYRTVLDLWTERAKQELFPLSYRWVSPQNVEYYTEMNVKENLFPQKIKIKVFLYKITKTSQDLLTSQSCVTEFSHRELATNKLSEK